MKELFDKISFDSAKSITLKYSTSFSIAVRLLAPSIRQAIYNIYGFVRVADEIVDTFDDYPQEEMLDRFEEEYHYAMKHGISANPVINSFQHTVREYNIDPEQVDAFLGSMRADLTKTVYKNQEEISEYIYGSADVVGLMCLKVFVNGNESKYEELKDSAMKLGSAFQKVNFLRDLKQDYNELSRQYFPNINPYNLSEEDKHKIVEEINEEFNLAFQGIKKLPNKAKFGVYVAYKYYTRLLRKISKTPSKVLVEKRIRVSQFAKMTILLKSYFVYNLRLR